MKIIFLISRNKLEAIAIFTLMLIFLSACNGLGSSGVGSTSQPQYSMDMLNTTTVSGNQTSQSLLDSTVANQQYFTVLQATESVTIASETITFYTDAACNIVSSAAVFTGPATYFGGSGGHTTDQSLYYTCANMYTGGCTSEFSNVRSVKFSYTLTNGQTTTMNCMTNEKIGNYSTTPATSCTNGSPCGFSIAYSTYILFPAFAWVGGESTANAKNGVYGTKGTASTTNIPGSRFGATSWTGSSNILWMFGGTGYSSSGTQSGLLNDLWTYNISTNLWTWVSGANTLNQVGTYGTKGTAAAANVPGSRFRSAGRIDGSSNLWLFGGTGYARNSASSGLLNDLWRYNSTTSQWTWVSGANSTNQTGTYGTKGTPSSTTTPGSRSSPTSWLDKSGNLWIFGGSGYATTTTTTGQLNDLWKYNSTTGQWTWVSGANSINQAGTYGTKGTSSASNVPGGRASSIGWLDESDNLWLFGGTGYTTSTTTLIALNDLWKYNISTNQWTWMSGSNSTTAQSGIYGTRGVPAVTNMPGGRYRSISWIDNKNCLWLFGGLGLASTSTLGDLNDLWKYNISTNQWTWMSGANAINQTGVYGTKSVSSSSNIPGSRDIPVSWIDSSNNLWLFSGESSSTATVYFNDLWKINLGY